VVATTIYVRNVADYMENIDVINAAYGENLPTSTLVGVTSLILEEQQVEVAVVAYSPSL
jgi:enamine deaminase RidA (YjgF/YER057c/UK114 family)